MSRSLRFSLFVFLGVTVSLPLVALAKEDVPVVLGAEPCNAGLTAFTATTHMLVRAHCTACHENNSGPKIGPLFAVSNARESYQRILRYVSFESIASSYFVQKGGNRHCAGYGVDCGIGFDEIKASLEGWWDKGQQSCPRQGVFTEEKELPNDLPEKPGFRNLRWDLSSVGAAFKGVFFEIEAQRFSKASFNQGSYKFRRPRILTSEKAIYLRGVHVWLNGRAVPLATSYSSIESTVAPLRFPSDPLTPMPHPMLSSQSLIVLEDKGKGDKIAFSFDELTEDRVPECRALAQFQSLVLPVMRARNCTYCHQSGAGTSFDRLDLSGSDAMVCQKAIQRVDFGSPTTSPWITLPLSGASQHPRVIPTPDEVLPDWIFWMQSERTAHLEPTFRFIRRAVLEKKCIGCHSDSGQASDYPLSDLKAILASTDKIIVPGKPDESLLVSAMMSTGGGQMPPKGERVSKELIQLIRHWIEIGAPE